MSMSFKFIYVTYIYTSYWPSTVILHAALILVFNIMMVLDTEVL